MSIHGLVFNGKFLPEADNKSVICCFYFLVVCVYYFHFAVVSCCLEDVLHFWTFFLLISDDYTLHGPIFTQEPSHVMFPLNSEEKKVKLNCEVKGNPKPHIRFVNLTACVSWHIVCIIKTNKNLWGTDYIKIF